MNVPSVATLVAALLIPVIAGCERSTLSTGTSSGLQGGGSRSWNVPTTHPIGGLDYARVEYANRDNQLVVLIWTDLKSGGAQTSSTAGHGGGFSLRGSFQSPDLKKPIDFQCQAQGIGRGTLTLDAATYELANGSLFLVSSTGEKPVVKQLKRDTTGLNLDVEGLRAFASTDPEISGFFKAAKK